MQKPRLALIQIALLTLGLTTAHAQKTYKVAADGSAERNGRWPASSW